MKSRRILMTVMALLLCASFVACTPSGSDPTQAPATTAASQNTTAPAGTADPTDAPVDGYVKQDYSGEAPLKVSFTGVAWGNGAEENGLVEQLFEEMLNLDMDVSWIPYTDYVDRVNVMMVSNSLTDVVQIYPQNGKAYYPQMVQAVRNGVFHDLTPYVYDNGFKDSNEIMKNWSETIWDNTRFEGKIYVIPRRLNEMANQSAVWYRQDLLETTDLSEPTTVDELKQFIIDFQAAYPDMYGLNFSSNDVDGSFKMIITSFVGFEEWAMSDDGTVSYASFTPEYEDFLLWVKDLYDAGAIDPEFALNQTATSSFEEGKSLVKLNNWQNWNQSADLVTNKWFKTNVEDGAAVWACGPLQGSKATAVSVGDGSGFSQPVAISSNFNLDNIDRLLQAICRDDEEYLWFLHYGQEDTHYTMVDGWPTQVNDEQKAARSTGYVGGWNQILLDSDPNHVTDKFQRSHASQEMIDRAVSIRDASNAAIEQYNLGNPIITLVSDTYDNKWPGLIKDIKDNRVKVVMGEMSIEDWRTYVNGLKESADYQKMVEEFKAASQMQ